MGRGDAQRSVAVPSAPARTSPRLSVRFRTTSGSVYTVIETLEGRFWMSASNRTSPLSSDLAGEAWEIERPLPWPPQVGMGVTLMAPRSLGPDDPRRAPGGGKITSPVVDIEVL